MPAEFVERRKVMPAIYLPMGLCEPHGHIAAFGLDTHKAEYLCEEAARRFGGIVAPTQGYHVHETGYHALWLEEVVGGVNPLLGALPPDLVLRTLLFQLRAFANAGFRLIIVISGHHGAQDDLRLVADAFMEAVDIDVVARTDPELVTGRFAGDHAGRFEISQLLYIRPDLVDMSRLERIETDRLGRFAQGLDAGEASADYGRAIVDAQIAAIGAFVSAFTRSKRATNFVSPVSLSEMEPVWSRILKQRDNWASLNR